MKPSSSYRLTTEVFTEAERQHRDLMEPWSSRVAEAQDASERQAVMRQGLAATFRQRYPMPAEYWPKDLSESARGAVSAETATIGVPT